MISYIWLLIGILLWSRKNLHSGNPTAKLCWRQRCHQNSEFYQPLTDVNCWISILLSVSRTPSPPTPDDSANPGLNWGSGQNLRSIAGSEHWLHVSVKFHLPREGQRGLAPHRSSIFPPYRLFLLCGCCGVFTPAEFSLLWPQVLSAAAGRPSWFSFGILLFPSDRFSIVCLCFRSRC